MFAQRGGCDQQITHLEHGYSFALTSDCLDVDLASSQSSTDSNETNILRKEMLGFRSFGITDAIYF